MDVAKQDVFAFVNYSPPHCFPIEDGTTEILIRVGWWLKEYREAVRHAHGGRMKLAYRNRVPMMFLREITAPQWEWGLRLTWLWQGGLFTLQVRGHSVVSGLYKNRDLIGLCLEQVVFKNKSVKHWEVSHCLCTSEWPFFVWWGTEASGGLPVSQVAWA